MIFNHQNDFIQEIEALGSLAKVSLVLCITTGLLACSSLNTMVGGNTKKDALDSTNYSSDPNGIILSIQAPEKLNYVGNASHTLALAIVQLNSSKAALALAKSSVDLDALLAGVATSNAAVVAVDRYIIQPSAVDTITARRAQDSQVVVIYAAYFDSLLVKRVRVYEIPVKVSAKGWVAQTYSANPLPLNLSLNLGETEIIDLVLVKTSDDDSGVSSKKENPTLQGAQPVANPVPSKVMGL